MKTDLDALEALAKAATPGPWESFVQYGPRVIVFEAAYSNRPAIIETLSDNEINNANFVAAANPAVVIELVKELAEYRCLEVDTPSAYKVARLARLLVDGFEQEQKHRAAKSSGGQHVGHTNNVFTSAPPSVMQRFERLLRDAGVLK